MIWGVLTQSSDSKRSAGQLVGVLGQSVNQGTLAVPEAEKNNRLASVTLRVRMQPYYRVNHSHHMPTYVAMQICSARQLGLKRRADVGELILLISQGISVRYWMQAHLVVEAPQLPLGVT